MRAFHLPTPKRRKRPHRRAEISRRSALTAWAGLDDRWRQLLFHHRVKWCVGSQQFCFESSPSGRRCRRNPRAQLVPLFHPMLTPMYVGRAMACTHDHAPLSKRTSPMCVSVRCAQHQHRADRQRAPHGPASWVGLYWSFTLGSSSLVLRTRAQPISNIGVTQ